MQTVRSERVEAVVQQQELLESIMATAADRAELADLQERAAVLGVRGAVYDRTMATLNNIRGQILTIVEGVGGVEEWPENAGENDLLSGVRAKIAEAANNLRIGIGIVESAGIDVQTLIEQNSADRLMTDEKARASRRALDELQAGAGALTRQVEVLTEREAQLGALEDLAKDRAGKVVELQKQRRDVFDKLEDARAERFQSRARSVISSMTIWGPG